MISQELRDWVRKRNKEDLKEWIAKKYEDEYKDDLTSSDWDDYNYPSRDKIYECLRTRFSKDYKDRQKDSDTQHLEFEEWLMERHFKEWMEDTRYDPDRKLRYSEEYEKIKRGYKKEIINLENQISAEELKLNNLHSYSDRYARQSDDYARQSEKVNSLSRELARIRGQSKKCVQGLSGTEILRSIRQQKYTSLQGEPLRQQREPLPLQRKSFHCDPILYALLIHSNDLSVPSFAFPIHLKILVKGSTICGRLISEYAYTSVVSRNLSVVDNLLHSDFNREVSYYSEVAGELYLHLDTDDYKDIDTETMFRYIRISIHDVDAFSICQFNPLPEDL